MNIPFERKKKTCGKRRAGSKQQQQIIMFNFLKYIFELMINTA